LDLFAKLHKDARSIKHKISYHMLDFLIIFFKVGCIPLLEGPDMFV